MSRFRYRTAALTGPWRATCGQAIDDAVRAHQAVVDDSGAPGLRWRVPGLIEEEGERRAA